MTSYLLLGFKLSLSLKDILKWQETRNRFAQCNFETVVLQLYIKTYLMLKLSYIKPAYNLTMLILVLNMVYRRKCWLHFLICMFLPELCRFPTSDRTNNRQTWMARSTWRWGRKKTKRKKVRADLVSCHLISVFSFLLINEDCLESELRNENYLSLLKCLVATIKAAQDNFAFETDMW